MVPGHHLSVATTPSLPSHTIINGFTPATVLGLYQRLDLAGPDGQPADEGRQRFGRCGCIKPTYLLRLAHDVLQTTRDRTASMSLVDCPDRGARGKAAGCRRRSSRYPDPSRPLLMTLASFEQLGTTDTSCAFTRPYCVAHLDLPPDQHAGSVQNAATGSCSAAALLDVSSPNSAVASATAFFGSGRTRRMPWRVGGLQCPKNLRFRWTNFKGQDHKL